MGQLTRFLARQIWIALVWYMRRPPIKRMRRNVTGLMPGKFGERARQSLSRQDRFARRYGITMLTWSLNLLFASLFITGTYVLVTTASENGWLTVPGSEDRANLR